MKTTLLTHAAAHMPDACRLAATDLQATGSHVRLGADGLPAAFRVLAYGPVSWTSDSTGPATVHGVLTPALADEAVVASHARGNQIPLDCEHVSADLAKTLGLEENDPAVAPLLGERLAAGYAHLVAEADGLWAHVDQWAPRAALLLQERLYRYFSPVLRGIRQGPLRLTSIALTNRPALHDQPALLASDATPALPVFTPAAGPAATQTPGGPLVDPKLKMLIAQLIGSDPAADLPADAADKLQAAVAALQGGQEDMAACAAELGLKLEPAAAPSARRALVIGHLKGLAASKANEATLTADLTAVKAELAKRDRDAVLKRLVDAGKLTPAQVAGWAGAADVATLTAYEATAPVLVAGGKLVTEAQLSADRSPAPSSTLSSVATACGLDPVKVAAVKLAGE